MALNIFIDSGATEAVSPTEYFIGDGTTKAFTLSKFIGSAVTAVYKETKSTIPSCSFTAGVSNALATMTANEFVGYAAYHQMNTGSAMTFRGYVLSNTTTQITLDNIDYTSGLDTLVLIRYDKQNPITEYAITSNTISFIAAPVAGVNIYAVGSNPASLNFGGDLTAGELVTTELKLYVKRDPGYAYSTIQISSDNLSQTAQSSSWVNATAVTVGSDTVITLGGTDTFNSTNSEVGKAVSRAGVFIGVIASNTSNTATILGVTGVTAAAAIYTIYTVGELWVANDNGSNAPGTYRKVLQGAMDVPGIPSTIDDNTVYPIWVKGTVPLPINATNYAENVIKVSATEFLA